MLPCGDDEIRGAWAPLFLLGGVGVSLSAARGMVSISFFSILQGALRSVCHARTPYK